MAYDKLSTTPRASREPTYWSPDKLLGMARKCGLPKHLAAFLRPVAVAWLFAGGLRPAV